MDIKGMLFLNRSECSSLLSLDEYIICIEEVFKAHAEGKSYGIGLMHGDTPGELEFHIKAGGVLVDGNRYYGLKINASSFSNMKKYGLPNIMGAIILFDAEKGLPLAIIDSGDPTLKRTGAGTAVAVKYLARKDADTLLICGCGKQGRIQLRSACRVREIKRVYAFSPDFPEAQSYSVELSKELGIQVNAVPEVDSAAIASDIVITATPSRKPILFKNLIKPGAFIAAIGADSPVKQELDTSLFQGTKVVVDILDQCAKVGDLHHAIDAGIIKKEDVHGEIGAVIAGLVTGRETEEEIIIYDATGTALQDTAAAALCYCKAIETGRGRYLDLFQ